MEKNYFEQMYDSAVPIIFGDGTKVYEELKKEYKTHKNGLQTVDK